MNKNHAYATKFEVATLKPIVTKLNLTQLDVLTVKFKKMVIRTVALKFLLLVLIEQEEPPKVR